ncbi:hypothetical protein L226DRAFT_536830 [Lentinus tigrinus ALCF2SS1-7]|uniref:F-box domain-containing protein n=1 Tax=Lentinus tigrinus ALCF2SS1-6 TaxID=1328759 RepID=A0A5C2S3J9_9APHY|nr:hypothetical protein L227DRAFT_191005 [Lentinus tigrinus ALCF2SS1-6]RPD72997.1 hypothetical protein L226DRAFT_536830 [Lentinus tigrinus ALCF2SS1-7]
MEGEPELNNLTFGREEQSEDALVISIPRNATPEELDDFKDRLKKWNQKLTVARPLSSSPSNDRHTPIVVLSHQCVGIVSNTLLEKCIWSLPLELWYEVLQYLNPKDLLSLRRTCKALYSFLSNKLQIRVWDSAIEPLPPCPGDICPIRYAQLLFGKTCFACGRSKSHNVSRVLGLRLCDSCWEDNIVPKHHVEDYIDAMVLAHPELETDPRLHNPLELLRWDVVSSPDEDQTPFYSKIEVRMFVAEYLPMLAALLRCGTTAQDALEIALRNRQEFVGLWDGFDRALEGVAAELAFEETKLCDARETDINNRLQVAGYQQESFPTKAEPGFDEWKRLVHKPKALTDQKWATLLPKLQELIVMVQGYRWEEAEEIRVRARTECLLGEYDLLVASHRLSEADRPRVPNHAHAQQLPSIAVLAKSHDFPHLSDLQRMFRGRASDAIAEAMQWRENTELKLFKMLADLYADFAPDMLKFAATDLTSFAASLFQCMVCADTEDESGSKPMPLNEVLAHWRQCHPDVLLTLEGGSSNARGREPMVMPYRDSWCYLRCSELATDITLQTMDDYVARGMIYCPCKISLLHRYTWADLVDHCVKEVEWMYSMYPGCWTLEDDIRRRMPNNHSPGCLTFVQNEADVPKYEYPDEATKRAIARCMRPFAYISNILCSHCKNGIVSRKVDCHASPDRMKALSRIAVSADQPWNEITHHLRTKHGWKGFAKDDITIHGCRRLQRTYQIGYPFS